MSDRTTVTVETTDGWVTIDADDITLVCIPHTYMTHYSWIVTTTHDGPIVVDTHAALDAWAAWTGADPTEHPAAQGDDDVGAPMYFERDQDPADDG